MIAVRFTFTEAVALQMHRELNRAVTPMLGYFPFFGLLMILGFICAWVSDPQIFEHGFGSAALIPLIFCATPLITRFLARRQFWSNPNAGLEVTWIIDGTRLSVETVGASSVFEWNKFVRIKEVKDGFLLFQLPKMAQWLPKSGFSTTGDIEQFRVFVRESGVKSNL